MVKKSFTWKEAEQLKKDCQEQLAKSGSRKRHGEMNERNTFSIKTNSLPKENPSLSEIERGQYDFDSKDASVLGISSYGEWAESSAIRDEEGNVMEPSQANPDQCSAEAGFFGQSMPALFSEGQVDTASSMLQEIQSLLTDKQFVIYDLHVNEGFNFSEVAIKLVPPISKQVVQKTWLAIEKKLKKRFGKLRENGGTL